MTTNAQRRTPPPHHTIAPPRSQLARLCGRVVTCEATYSNVARRTAENVWLYHLADVLIYPSASFSHLWVDVPQQARRKLYEGTRFTFQGEVIRYERSNGSEDYGIVFRKWVRG